MRETLSDNKRALLRAYNSLSEVASWYVKLKRKGMIYTGDCPFHKDHRLHSLIVNEEQSHFLCSGCGAQGDVVDFICRVETVPPGRAAKFLRVR